MFTFAIPGAAFTGMVTILAKPPLPTGMWNFSIHVTLPSESRNLITPLAGQVSGQSALTNTGDPAGPDTGLSETARGGTLTQSAFCALVPAKAGTEPPANTAAPSIAATTNVPPQR